MPNFWFVRHGESLAQLDQWDGPDPETPLSTEGERQASAMMAELASLDIQRVLVSPFLRARQTAERAMAKWGRAPLAVPDPISAPISTEPKKGTGTSASLRSQSPFQIVEDLRERNSGDWLANFRREQAINEKMSIWDFVPPNGESIKQAAIRAIQALNELESDKHTAVFAHGRVLAGVLALLDQRDLTQPVHALENCVVYPREIAAGTWRELLATQEPGDSR